MKSVDEAEWRLERIGRARVAARGGAVETVRAALESAGSLFDWAAARPDARRLDGRGAAYRVGMDGADWLVRHYRRGGAVAVHLGDRYARVGRPRPFHELAASQAARARGVPTPAVMAAVVYPSGIVYRGDIAVAFIPRSRTLADALFGAAGDEGGRERSKGDRGGERSEEHQGGDRGEDAGRRAMRVAAAAIRQAHEGGLVHPDLNIRNILLAETGEGLRGYILDLDGARVVQMVGTGARRRMIRRFWRSVRKWEAMTGRSLSERVRQAFDAGYEAGRAHE